MGGMGVIHVSMVIGIVRLFLLLLAMLAEILMASYPYKWGYFVQA